MINIVVLTIPHKAQRYPTVGDYFYDYNNKTLQVRVSDSKHWRYEALVLIHELVEYFLCERAGVSLKDIDAFDMAFEKDRARRGKGWSKDYTPKEPGDSPSAPYYKQHKFATKIEKLLAKELGVKWRDYEKALDSL